MIASNVILFIAALTLVGISPLDSAQDQAKQKKPKRQMGTIELSEILEQQERYADSAFVYEPDPEALAIFRAVNRPVVIKMFYRTDCSDSIREVPRFIKTIQLADNPNITVDAIGVNKAKRKPKDLVKGWDLMRVPTFIVVNEGQEVGRVVERPVKRVEVEMAELLKQFTK